MSQLVIHDLSNEDWSRISGDYPGCEVVSDNGSIRPCIGCFCCWNKTPGQCAVRDGYENMGSLIHHADEVVVISRCTYGGFSGFVKNVFDRCLGYVLPQFEVIRGETHHKKRYDETKPFTFIFYGADLSEAEKDNARRYVQAVCANIRGYVKEVVFREAGSGEAGCEERSAQPVQPERQEISPCGRTVLLNGSMRSETGNSARLARQLMKQIKEESRKEPEKTPERTAEIVNLRNWLSDLPGLVRELEDAQTIVLCVPLYVDGLPSQVIRLLEDFRDGYRGGCKKIYVLANMGLYESSQLVNLFSAVRQWTEEMGFEYCGGLGLSAGELVGVLMQFIPFSIGPTKKISKGMDRLASAVARSTPIEDIYAEPHHFPRALYIKIANDNWNRTAKRNGIRPEELYRQ